MSLEQYDGLHENVKAFKESGVFHILKKKDTVFGDERKTACGTMRAIQSADKAKQMSPQEATRKGRRPCKDCISHIERAYDLDISRCTICRRMNILHDVPFSSYEIEYGHKENREGSICLNCQVSVLD